MGVDGNKWMAFIFSGNYPDSDHIAIREKEWFSIQGKIGHLMLE
jgi:hypothetical protein